MTRDDLIAAIHTLCMTYAETQVAHARAQAAPTDEDRNDLLARSEQSYGEMTRQYAAIVDSINATVPEDLTAIDFMPVQPLPTGEIALHTRDEQARHVRLKLAGDQALAVGAHLTAYAAISLDRTGTKVDHLLPAMTTDPAPTTGHPTTEHPATATGHPVTAVPHPGTAVPRVVTVVPGNDDAPATGRAAVPH